MALSVDLLTLFGFSIQTDLATYWHEKYHYLSIRKEIVCVGSVGLAILTEEGFRDVISHVYYADLYAS